MPHFFAEQSRSPTNPCYQLTLKELSLSFLHRVLFALSTAKLEPTGSTLSRIYLRKGFFIHVQIQKLQKYINSISPRSRTTTTPSPSPPPAPAEDFCPLLLCSNRATPLNTISSTNRWPPSVTRGVISNRPHFDRAIIRISTPSIDERAHIFVGAFDLSRGGGFHKSE